jgi:hypothetical protein
MIGNDHDPLGGNDQFGPGNRLLIQGLLKEEVNELFGSSLAGSGPEPGTPAAAQYHYIGMS